MANCYNCGDPTTGFRCRECEFWEQVEIDMMAGDHFIVVNGGKTSVYSAQPPEVTKDRNHLLGFGGRIFVFYNPSNNRFVVTNNWWNRGYVSEFWEKRLKEDGGQTIYHINPPVTSRPFAEWVSEYKGSYLEVSYNELLKLYEQARVVWLAAQGDKPNAVYFALMDTPDPVVKFKEECEKLGVKPE